jgi:hypothetical protein
MERQAMEKFLLARAFLLIKMMCESENPKRLFNRPGKEIHWWALMDILSRQELMHWQKRSNTYCLEQTSPFGDIDLLRKTT